MDVALYSQTSIRKDVIARERERERERERGREGGRVGGMGERMSE